MSSTRLPNEHPKDKFATYGRASKALEVLLVTISLRRGVELTANVLNADSASFTAQQGRVLADIGELLNLRRANAKNQGSDEAVALIDETAGQQMRRHSRAREKRRGGIGRLTRHMVFNIMEKDEVVQPSSCLCRSGPRAA